MFTNNQEKDPPEYTCVALSLGTRNYVEDEKILLTSEKYKEVNNFLTGEDRDIDKQLDFFISLLMFER